MNTQQETKMHRALEDELLRLLSSEQQQFGRGGFYQSFPQLGITGQRPTDKRMSTYEMKALLTPEMSVLDIGSNCGFFALTLAPLVHSITGVELNPRLVQIARKTKEYLGTANAEFIASPFEQWNAGERQWDVVLSFAVHLWVRMPFEMFAAKLLTLLKPGGILLLESHNIHQNDSCFDERIKWMCHLGLELRRWGMIRDDGVHERIFAVLQRKADGVEA
ncbi:MAG: class I SAM-dependent methyltransferase [Kiritimatiellae bacterium]|nr:class I SAM-dependent methyltransferase [Kiritimatiellia bacterium]